MRCTGVASPDGDACVTAWSAPCTRRSIPGLRLGLTAAWFACCYRVETLKKRLYEAGHGTGAPPPKYQVGPLPCMWRDVPVPGAAQPGCVGCRVSMKPKNGREGVWCGSVVLLTQVTCLLVYV